MNLTDFLNSTKNLQIYVKPALNRDLDPDGNFQDGDVDLTWSVVDFDG